MSVAAKQLHRLVADSAARAQAAAANLSGPAPGHTQHVSVSPDACQDLAQWVAETHGDGFDILIADEHTWDAAGPQVQGALEAVGRRTRPVILEPRAGDDHVVCETGAIAALRTFLGAMTDANAIAIGAGTVNDIVKMASHQLERGYQVVATAASMNGYTSAIAAVLDDGVKRTLPCGQPQAVACPLDVLQAAPTHMNQAGFGDLLSKPFSQADWLLSHLVRDVPYDASAAEVLDEAYKALLTQAAGVPSGTAEAVQLLTETLLVSGFSMALAASN